METRSAQGQSSQAVLIKLDPGADVIDGIESVCRTHDIDTGVITCCIGSLESAAYLLPVPLDTEFGSGYGDPILLDGPLEIISGQGMIGKEENGDYFIHLHGTLSDKNRQVHGGHFIKGQATVLITCEIMISLIQGIKMIRTYDPTVDMKVLQPFSHP